MVKSKYKAVFYIVLSAFCFALMGLFVSASGDLPTMQKVFFRNFFALFIAMIIASLVGTTIPMVLHKIGIDPAVASGPMITTVNDLIATMVYYGLALALLINAFHMGTTVAV